MEPSCPADRGPRGLIANHLEIFLLVERRFLLTVDSVPDIRSTALSLPGFSHEDLPQLFVLPRLEAASR